MKISKYYAEIIVNNPLVVIILALLITAIGIGLYDRLVVENVEVDEILPNSFPVVSGMEKLSDNLGGGEGTAFMIVVELDSSYGSQINDIRDPQIIRYTKSLADQVLKVEDITGTSGLGDNIYGLNDNKPVNSLRISKKIIEDNPTIFDRIVNDKYSLTIIRVYANQDFDVGELTNEVQKIIDNTQKPDGVKTLLAGESIAEEVSRNLVGPDSARTTQAALIAIVLILFLTFRHIIYGSLPLFTILFGVLWTFGFMAGAGLRMTSFSSGAISMIVGIGIDFGIQTIMRFRQELVSAKPVPAMQKTLENVIKPMFITTIASFIGFWSMTFGDFIVLGELGKIMALGVIFCFFSAITVVPAISVLYEKYIPKKKFNPIFKIIKRFFLLIGGKANIK